MNTSNHSTNHSSAQKAHPTSSQNQNTLALGIGVLLIVCSLALAKQVATQKLQIVPSKILLTQLNQKSGDSYSSAKSNESHEQSDAFIANRLTQLPNQPLVLAPMLSSLDACLQNALRDVTYPLEETCLGASGSAAALVNATLAQFGESPRKDWQWGYTLKAPLFDFLIPKQNAKNSAEDINEWQVNSDAIKRLMNTIKEVKRPVVLYLFSTHFASLSPVEKVLAKDLANRAVSAKGVLPVDLYLGLPLYPWSVASTNNSLTQKREQVIDAIGKEICQLSENERERIIGVTLLGEVHHLFPDFNAGMGFNGDYEISDYSETSQAGFRRFLKEHYGNLQAFKAALGAPNPIYPNWESIRAPDRNIRKEKLDHFWQHIDAYAHGVLPISGWVAPDPTYTDEFARAKDVSNVNQGRVQIWLNGRWIANAAVGLGREDVSQALPEFKTSNVGWRYDFDFSQLPSGIHQLDLYLERKGQDLQHLGTRKIALIDRQQNTPKPQSFDASLLPKINKTQSIKAVKFSWDLPNDSSDYYYNPLVALWHAFRNQQVVDYIEHFQKVARRTCLGERPLFSHQLVPYANPSWDANKYAVDGSLSSQKGLSLGISLYGEIGYTNSLTQIFNHWKTNKNSPLISNKVAQIANTNATARVSLVYPAYGITEFHPITSLNPAQLENTLVQHHQRGARFISMFVEGLKPDGKHVVPKEVFPFNPFSFDAQNPHHHSDQLFNSLKKAWQEPSLQQQ